MDQTHLLNNSYQTFKKKKKYQRKISNDSLVSYLLFNNT